MKHTVGLYVWSGTEAYERKQIKYFWSTMQLCKPAMEKLQRYQAKLCQYFSEGIYDHMKALDLIFYAVDFQRRLQPEVIRASYYTAWQVTRAIVKDLEKNHFNLPPSELRRFWDQEQEEENKVFEIWWELHKKGLTKTARGEYNVYDRASTVQPYSIYP